jgi:hypothetical protein
MIPCNDLADVLHSVYSIQSLPITYRKLVIYVVYVSAPSDNYFTKELRGPHAELLRVVYIHHGYTACN